MRKTWKDLALELAAASVVEEREPGKRVRRRCSVCGRYVWGGARAKHRPGCVVDTIERRAEREATRPLHPDRTRGSVDLSHQIKDVLSSGYLPVLLGSLIDAPVVEGVAAAAFVPASRRGSPRRRTRPFRDIGKAIERRAEKEGGDA